MQTNFAKSLKMVLKHEGGWSDNPKDPGGATMKGVTLKTFSAFLGHAATKEELRAITDEQLGDIYKNNYWNACKCDELPAGLDYVVFDLAVNGGPGRSAKILQKAVGTNADGKIGPGTLKAVASAVEEKGADTVIQAFSEERQRFYESLSTFATFGKGWTRRVQESTKAALEMV